MEKLCADAGAAVAAGAACVEASAWEEAGGQYGAAAGALELALVEALCKQASCLMQADKHGAALAAAARAAAVAPRAALPHYWAALAHERLGARAKASVAYKKAAGCERDLSRRAMYADAAARCAAEEETVRRQADEQLAAARRMAEATAAERAKMDGAAGAAAAAAAAAAPLAPAAAAAAAAPVVAGVKMDWYQSADWVNVDVMCKGVDRARSAVTITATSLEMTLARAGKEDWSLRKELFAEVDAGASRWSVGKYKVEVHLRKKAKGPNWLALDKDAEVASATVRAGALAARRMKDVSEKQKGWEKTADDELKDYKEDDSAMAVFRQLYSASDEDTRKAMVKSYSESGGQVLSTNWGEVKKERVKYTPVEKRDK